MNVKVPNIFELSTQNANLWKVFKKRWSNYVLLADISKWENSKQVALLENLLLLTCVLGFKAIGRVFDFIELFNRP